MAELVDAPDLKSVDCKDREGSSPSAPIPQLNIVGYTISVMKYQLETEYAWYDTQEGSKVILVYLIQNVPFTFDELPEIARNLPEVEQTANGNKRWSTEEMYKASMYLMAEECHPMMYELEIENPELLPVD